MFRFISLPRLPRISDMSYLSELITVVVCVGGVLIQWGITKNEISNLKEQVTQLEEQMKTLHTQGTGYSRESVGRLNQTVEYHCERLEKVENQGESLLSKLAEIHTSVELIKSALDSKRRS